MNSKNGDINNATFQEELVLLKSEIKKLESTYKEINSSIIFRVWRIYCYLRSVFHKGYRLSRREILEDQQSTSIVYDDTLLNRLVLRKRHLKKLRIVLKQIYKSKTYKVIRFSWKFQNSLKLYIFSLYLLLFVPKFRSKLLEEDQNYDRNEYLKKIIRSRAFIPLKFYWNLKDLTREVIAAPYKIIMLKYFWSEIREKDKKYNREDYLTIILKTRYFRFVRLYWQYRAVIKLCSVFRGEPTSKFISKVSEIFSSKNVDKKVSTVKEKHYGVSGVILTNIENEFKKGNWDKVKKLSLELIDKFPNNTLLEGKAKLMISVVGRLLNLSKYKMEAKRYSNNLLKRTHKKRVRKIAVFTAITNDYDSVKLPEYLDPKLDYVLFTDKPVPDSGIFRVKPITYFNEDPTRESRFVKTHPHTLLEGYDVAIWLDSNIMILGDIYPLVESFLNSGLPVAAVPHPLRTNVYEEFEECILRNKDDLEVMKEQIEHYKALKFEHNDLIESNFMMFNLKNTKTRSFLDNWWGEIEKFSRRDQLGLNFALRESNLDWYKLTKKPVSARNNKLFAFSPHDFNEGPATILLQNLSSNQIDPYIGKPYSEVRSRRILKERKRRIDVVVCVHNALEDVKLCLNSVEKVRNNNRNQKLILIDDGSDKSTSSYLRKFAKNKYWVKLIHNSEALGYTRAANQGLKAANGDLVILLNSDTIVTDGWVEKMADSVFSTSGAGIVGPMSNAASYQSIPNIHGTNGQTAINKLPAGMTPEDMNKKCEEWTFTDILPLVPLVHGFCLGISREVLNKIGYFDEINFPKGYGEENDYCLRATNAGFTLVVATHTYIFHRKTRSYTRSARTNLVKIGAKKLRKLHGHRRIENAVHSMENNHLLKHLREKAKLLI